MTPTRKVVAGPDVPSEVGRHSPAVRGGDLLFVSGRPGDRRTGRPRVWRAGTSRVAETSLRCCVRAPALPSSSSPRPSSSPTR